MTDYRVSRLLAKLEIPLLLAVPAVMAAALLAGVEQAALAMLVVVALVLATPAQQKILHRIAAQRERIQARQQAYAQANSAAEAGAAGIGDDSLVLRCVAFAKQHPAAVVALAGAAMALGPSRLVRWASVALPWILRFRR